MVYTWSCVLFCFFFQAEDGIRDLYVTGVQTCALPIYLPHGCPTRQERRATPSSSSTTRIPCGAWRPVTTGSDSWRACCRDWREPRDRAAKDRKSTRLNSSHVEISYAVFCLKKKKNKET